MEEYLMKALILGSETIESFRSHRTHSQLRQLPLSSFYSCAADNSGPIALLYRKYDQKQTKLPQHYDTNILIFNCRGELIRMIPFDLKERVLLFELTQQEHLLIVYATGAYFLVDTATSALVQGNYLSEDEDGRGKSRCLGAQMIEERIVLLRDKTLGLVDKLTGHKWKPLPAVKIHSQFSVFQCITNRNHELQIVYLSSAYEIQLYNPKGKTNSPELLYSHPQIRTLAPLLISMSYSNGMLVLIFADFLIWVNCRQQKENRLKLGANIYSSTNKIILSGTTLSERGLEAVKVAFGEKVVFFGKNKIQKDDPMAKTNSNKKYRNFYRIGWVDSVCYFSDRRHFFFTTPDRPSPIQLSATESSYLLASSKSILRLIDEHTYVLRVINDPIYFTLSGQSEAVENCLKKVSRNGEMLTVYEHFKVMMKVYENFTERRLNSLEEIKVLEQYAEDILHHLLKAVEKALDAGLQLKILKMAEWVQTFFRIQNDIKDLIGRLRVVNGLKYEHLNRWLSLSQFQSLRNQRFLHLLLRSNMHYVADLIFQDSLSKKKIFMHWAKCKIQKQTPLTAIEQIKKRYQDMYVDLHSKCVFTQLALYALRRKTPLHDLALRLAENQPNTSKKCIVFLLVFKNKKSIQLIDKLLDFAEKSLCTAAMQLTLQTLRELKDQVSAAVWLQLLPKKPFLQSFYLKMLKAQNNQEQLQRYYELTKKFTELAYWSLGRQLKAESNRSLKTAIDLLHDGYAKILPSLTDSVSKCKNREWMDKLREVRDRKGPVSEEDGVGVTRDGDLQFLGELAANRDKNMGLALKFYKRMKSDKVYEILKLKGRPRDALEVAFQRKDKFRLAELVQDSEDEQVTAYGKQLSEQLSLPH